MSYVKTMEKKIGDVWNVYAMSQAIATTLPDNYNRFIKCDLSFSFSITASELRRLYVLSEKFFYTLDYIKEEIKKKNGFWNIFSCIKITPIFLRKNYAFLFFFLKKKENILSTVLLSA